VPLIKSIFKLLFVNKLYAIKRNISAFLKLANVRQVTERFCKFDALLK